MILEERCKIKEKEFIDYFCIYIKDGQLFFNDIKITEKEKEELLESYGDKKLEIVDMNKLTLEQGINLDKVELDTYLNQKRGRYKIEKSV